MPSARELAGTHRRGTRLVLSGHFEQDHGGAWAMICVYEGEAHAIQRVRLVQRHGGDPRRGDALLSNQQRRRDGGAIDLAPVEVPVQTCKRATLKVS